MDLKSFQIAAAVVDGVTAAAKIMIIVVVATFICELGIRQRHTPTHTHTHNS